MRFDIVIANNIFNISGTKKGKTQTDKIEKKVMFSNVCIYNNIYHKVPKI